MSLCAKAWQSPGAGLQNPTIQQEIPTAFGLGMTVVDGGWFFCIYPDNYPGWSAGSVTPPYHQKTLDFFEKDAIMESENIGGGSMEQKQHITTTPCFSPWYEYGSFFLFWFFYVVLTTRLFPGFAESFWGFPVSILVCGGASFLLGMRFLWGDILLDERGVKCCRRIGNSFLRWEDIIQVAAIRHDATRVLVLVKKGGVPLKSTKDHLLFFLRNPRKLVFLPDDKFTRAFVTEFYGPVDIREPKDTD